ncbi:MAG TPA: PAS domain S-box protein [Chloroflexota bacterium]|jgi:PAS domain S-box-containing protein|nr:PAS domain S-box protein [Chloroflexota bacterium]
MSAPDGRAAASPAPSDDLYRVIADLTSDYLYALRVLPDGGVARAWSNDAFVQVTGYAAEEIDAPGAWQRLIHPDDLPRAYDHVVRLLAGERHQAEYRIVTKSGERRWLRDTGQPVRERPDGPVVWVYGAAQDVTAHKRDEERLRFLAEASVLLDSALDFATTLERVAHLAVPLLADWCQVDVFDAEDRFRTVATAHVDPEKQRLALELRRRYPPDPGHPHSIWAVYRSGKPALVSAAEELHRTQARDAEHARLLELMATRSFLRLPLRARDRTFGVLSFGSQTPNAFAPDDLPFFEDLARRAALAVDNARLYSALEVAEQRYHGLFEAAADAVLIADAEGRYVEANAAAEELLGYSCAELVGMGIADVVVAGPEWAEREFSRFRREGRWQGELDLRRKDGSVVPVECRANVIETAAGQLNVSALRDISERRAAEESQREFVALIGHELRNPLASLRGYAQLLARRKTYSEAAVEVIIQQVDRLNRLIGDLVDASRLERGRLELNRGPTDLIAIAHDAAESARGYAEGYTIRLDGPATMPFGRWDYHRIGQVLQNLLSNAIKYSPPGEILVRLEDEGGAARVSVVDHGPGISSQELPRLFQRFHRADSAAASDAAGLGLGLYICRGLVESHGGRIWVEPTPGGGATFSFTLPYGLMVDA